MLANRTIQAASGASLYQIFKSLRFRGAASTYLNKTFYVVGSRTTWTFSAWVKVSSFGTQRRIFTDTSGNSYIRFDATNNFEFNFWNGTTSYTNRTAAVYRDPSAWYHVVVSVDTTQATAANRVKVYINGAQITSWLTGPNYPPQNDVCQINNSTAHYVSSLSGSSEFFDGYMAEMNFVDGLALTPTSFGQIDPGTGVWASKKYTGAYGNNGFYLDFRDSSNPTAVSYDGRAGSYGPNLRLSGIAIGGYTANGGLASAFDGNANQPNASSARSTTPAAGYTAASAIGRDWGSGVTRTITGFRIFSQNDGGFVGGTSQTTNYKLQGSNDGTNYTDLMSPGTTTGATSEIVTVTSGITTTTAYRYHRVIFNANGSDNYYVTELELYEAGGYVMSPNNWTPNNINVFGGTTATFTSVGTTSWVAPAGVTSVQYLVVAGGGGGAVWGGGGGAGGFRQGSMTVVPGNSYTVTVGAGGAGGLEVGPIYDGSDGANSVFDTIVSTGGGGGGYNGLGRSGGSGGGGSFAVNGGYGGAGNTPATIPSQGNTGGTGSATIAYQAGGGGAGVVGGNGGGGSSGAGGNGLASSISGSSVTYAGGGGGGGGLNAGGNWAAGAGGAGGGGAGSQSSTGTNGTANTGGGGGASGRSTNTFFNAGNGGSGIVILAYGSNATCDSMLDVPLSGGISERGNYATLNPLQRILVGTLTGGNLDGYAGSNNMFRVSTLDLQRDTYYECLNTANTRVGLVWLPIQDDGSNWFGASTSYVLLNGGGALTTQNCSASQSATPSYSTGNTLGLAWNATARTLTLYVNNVLSTVVTVTSPTSYPHPLFANISSGVATSFSVNFGQRPFAYTPPTGFKALHTGNLPAPTIKKPNQYFDVSLWRGDGVGAQLVTNSGNFLPDLVWMKGRNFGSAGQNNVLVDSVRGVNIVLSSNLSDAQAAISSISAFNTNGFTTSGTFDNGYSGSINNMPYVGWQWKAGGAAITNNTGSLSASVSANPAAGFSIVRWTGNGASAQTIGHGLGTTPAMIIHKATGDAIYSWNSWHKGLSTNYYIGLNTTSAQDNSVNIWPTAGITSSVITTTSEAIKYNNLNGVNHIAYVFAEIAGYSRIGSYIGNGSVDGPFIYCGFSPKYIMLKRIDTTSDWYIHDTARDAYNYTIKSLFPNLSAAENAGELESTYGIDFVSNGFKIRASHSTRNTSGGTYIFIAFAEAPFKNSLAR